MAAKDLGPLDWRTPIVSSAGTPSPQFQRLWNIQRNNNGLIGFVTVGDGPPTDAPAGDGELYVNVTSAPETLYCADGGNFTQVGVANFTQLKDVPGNYTSAAAKLVQVNGNATGLVFGNLTSILDEISVTEGSILYRGASVWQALAPGNASQVLQTNGSGAAPSWVTPTGGGGGGGLPAWYITPQTIGFNSNGGPATLWTPIWMEIGDTMSGGATIPTTAATLTLSAALYGPGPVLNGTALCASSSVSSVTTVAGVMNKLVFGTKFTATAAGIYWIGVYQSTSLGMYNSGLASSGYTTGILTTWPSTMTSIAGSTDTCCWGFR